MPRLFFALWPDDTVRLKLSRYRLDLARACEGRAVRTDTLHLTLVFIGEVDDARIDELAACADRVTARFFDLVVDTAGCFARARVGWLGFSKPSTKLFDLQLALRSEADQAGFGLDPRKFKPHVTVVRDVGFPFPRQKLPAINWKVRSFDLVESLPSATGPVYEILRTWELSNPPLT
jgi:2'-5' RNA ligase